METIPKKMRALIKKSETVSYELEMIDTPVPSGDEVLIKVEAVSICGSDINLYQWNDVARVIASVPFIPGHEAAGTVVQCGPEVTDVKVGDKVAVENHFYCGSCYQCEHDSRGTCINMGQYGHGKKTMHGGCCEYSLVSAKYCYVLRTHMSPEEAALLEPLGVSHNAIERLEVSGESVLIIGCGPVGLLAIPCAKAMGATRVLAADIDEKRLALARDLGADLTINTKSQSLKEEIMCLTREDGIGRIAEMSGASVMVNSMFSLLRKGGHVVMVGLPKQPLHVENVLTDIVFKSLTLKSIYGRHIYRTWEKVEEMVAKKQVDVTKVISHRVALKDFEDAFKALISGQAVKIVLFP